MTTSDLTPDTPGLTTSGLLPDASRPTVAKVRSPADLAACVPELLGFRPTESLLVLALHEPRGRLGLLMRLDLGPLDEACERSIDDIDDIHDIHDGARDGQCGWHRPEDWGTGPSVREDLLDTVLTGLERDGASRVAIVVVTEEPDAYGELPRADLVADLFGLLEPAGFAVMEALLVRDGRWWSFLCSGDCCPTDGQPVQVGRGPAGLIAAERVLAGDVVLGSRADVAAQLKAELPLGSAVPESAFRAAAAALAAEVEADPERAELAALDRLTAALAAPEGLTVDESAACVAALELRLVRETVVAWAVADATPVRRLGVALCRSMPDPYVAPALLAVGVASYLEGNGTLARIALERCLGHAAVLTMASLLLSALDNQLLPAQVQAALQASVQRSEDARGPSRGNRRTGRRRGSADR